MIYKDLLILTVIALLLRLLTALPQQQPNYMDAAYSTVNAINLAQGRGFVEDFIWNYLDDPAAPPNPSHLYWMPLTSMLAGLGMVIGGLNYRAAQIPFVVLSALLAPLSYWLADIWTGRRRLAWLAGLLAIFSGFYVPFWPAIDNFTPFAIFGSLALLLAWKGDHDGSQLLLFIAGSCVGLAHLSRADGPLLLVAISLIFAWHYAFRSTIYLVHCLVLLLLGYLLIMMPWFIRNWQVAGTWLSAAGSQTIWLSSYDELFSYGRTLSPQTFLAQGWGKVLQGRWWALTANLQTVVAAWGMIFLTPLAVIGGWKLRHNLLLQMALLYGLLLFLALTLVFAFPGARGGLFHSGAALLPFIYAAAALGLDESVNWLARRRRRWDAPAARLFFSVGLVLLAVGLSSFIYYQRVLRNNVWNRADPHYAALAAWIGRQSPPPIVIIGNPPAYRYHGGGLSIMTPNENLETLLQVAQHYKARYLVLESNHPQALHALYLNPTNFPELVLVQTYGRESAQPVYIFLIGE